VFLKYGDQFLSTITQSQVAAPTIKTYRNEDQGFEFKYPSDWSFHENTFRSSSSKFNLTGAGPKEGNNPNPIRPSVLINIVTKDFAENAAIARKNLGATISSVSIGDFSGLKYEYTEQIPKISVDVPQDSYNTRSGFPRNLLRDPCRKVWKPLVSIIRLEGMAVKKTHHNAYTTHYHFVFPVKYRKALLNGDIPLAINRLAEEIANRYDIEFEKIGYDNDHIHILASFPPKHSGSEVVRIFKSITARELFKQFPLLKKDLWGGEFWSDGFYMATVSERGNWSVVEQYVASQGKTKEELRQPHLFA